MTSVGAHSSKRYRAWPRPRTTAFPHPPTPHLYTRRGLQTLDCGRTVSPFPSAAAHPGITRLPYHRVRRGQSRTSVACCSTRAGLRRISPLCHMVPATVTVVVHLLLPALDEILNPDQLKQSKHLLLIRGCALSVPCRGWVPEGVMMGRVNSKPRPHRLEEVFGGCRCCIRAGLAATGGELLWVYRSRNRVSLRDRAKTKPILLRSELNDTHNRLDRPTTRYT